MTPEEKKVLLDLAKTWQSAADLYKRAMRRNLGFAKTGRGNWKYHQTKAAHKQIEAETYELHSKELMDLLNQLAENSTKEQIPTGPASAQNL